MKDKNNEETSKSVKDILGNSIDELKKE